MSSINIGMYAVDMKDLIPLVVSWSCIFGLIFAVVMYNDLQTIQSDLLVKQKMRLLLVYHS